MNFFKKTCFGFFFSLLLYGRLLPYAFTQDDFFLLRQARFNTSLQQFNASLPQPDSIYFRPIGMQGYFFIAWRLFGLHPWAYRLVALFIHSLNATFVYLLAKKILLKNSWIVWLLYLTAPLHFAAIGWIANISFITGTFFVLLTILAALLNRPVWNVGSLYVLALLTNELAITCPFLIVIVRSSSRFGPSRREAGEAGLRRGNLEDKSDRHGFQKSLAMTRLDFFLIFLSILYLVFRFMMPRAASGSYQTDIGIHIIQNIRWLLLWTFGWAETTKDYFLSFWTIKYEFVRTFPFETMMQIVTTLLLSFALLANIKNKATWVGILFFLAAILPVLLFREHIYPHYAMIGSIGLFIAIVSGLNKLPKYVVYCVLALWFSQIISVMRVNLITHWWVHHVLLSAVLQQQLQEKYQTLPDSKQMIVMSERPDRATVVLSGDNAVQLLYNNPEVKALYQQQQ